MTAEFDDIFAALRDLMLAAAPNATIAADTIGDLVLHTSQVDPKTGKNIWFGAVALKKSYVAYHLFPLFTNPAIGEGISSALAKRRQGKSCFNFKTADAGLFAELTDLTRKAADS